MKKYEVPSLELIAIEADVVTASTFGGGIVIFDDEDDSLVSGVEDPYRAD